MQHDKTGVEDGGDGGETVRDSWPRLERIIYVAVMLLLNSRVMRR